MIPDDLRQRICDYVKKNFSKKPFIPGVTPIPASGKTFDEKEFLLMIEAVLDGWWTEGRFAGEFELRFARLLGRKFCITANSGSSANLLALTALTSGRLGKRKLQEGDEVIVPAASFPTTIGPIVQNRLIPVFVDIDPVTYNLDLEQLRPALSEKTKAIMAAHTLGNPFRAVELKKFCEENNLWLIEDACDALGSLYGGMPAGSFGHISTFSFYPAHHITMGEGGAIAADDGLLERTIRSFRDWGRDCWCRPGAENSCGKRFALQMGELPEGYDHKYIYSEVGYNLKLTDMQASLGLAQLDKLKTFGDARRSNHSMLSSGLSAFQNYLQLPRPAAGSDPSWFGFVIKVKNGAPFSRAELVEFLNGRKIGTRYLFAGNMIRQPVFTENKIRHRTVGGLKESDDVMNNAFWIGCHPGISEEGIEYVIASFKDFFNSRI